MSEQNKQNPSEQQTENTEASVEQAEAFFAQDTNDAQNQIENLTAENAALKDQLIRAQAEMQNTRKRAEEEIAKVRKFATESFAQSLLPVIDSLQAALTVENATAEQMTEGVNATLRQLISALNANQVSEIAPQTGEKFDPAQHQAISMIASEHPAQTIVTVLQKGYTISQRVIRPALVTVSSGQ